MLMAAPPIYRCIEAVKEAGRVESGAEKPLVVYLSPRGRLFTEAVAKEYAAQDQLILLCGHYEGIDERVIEESVDEELSIGDFVLTGGELPACIVADCVGRLCDGVLTLPECHEKESFEDDLLEYPQYTRPPVWMGREVPEVLLSGHHAHIEAWRHEKQLEITRERRPDLYARLPEPPPPKKKRKKKSASPDPAETGTPEPEAEKADREASDGDSVQPEIGENAV